MDCECGRVRVGEPFNRLRGDCPHCWLRMKAGLTVANRNSQTADRMYFEFPHGVGDCVQFTSVLRHLKKHRPQWIIDIACKDEGRAKLFTGLVNQAFTLRHNPGNEYAARKRIMFHEAPRLSKVWKCLRDEFKIEPEIELLPYQLNFPTLPKTNEIILHYKGASSKHKKDLDDREMSVVVQWILGNGFKPVILDWTTNARFHRGPATDMIAPLLDSCRAWVGIDSGPGHIGGAVDSPGLVVWIHHHPARFYEPCPNVEHLIPSTLGDRDFLNCHYKYHEYTHRKDVAAGIIKWLANKLGCESQHLNPSELTSKAYDVNYYEQHKQAGLDYAIHGDWQKEYGTWLSNYLTSVARVEVSQRESA